jgi:hypothetical protein
VLVARFGSIAFETQGRIFMTPAQLVDGARLCQTLAQDE